MHKKHSISKSGNKKNYKCPKQNSTKTTTTTKLHIWVISGWTGDKRGQLEWILHQPASVHPASYIEHVNNVSFEQKILCKKTSKHRIKNIRWFLWQITKQV